MKSDGEDRPKVRCFGPARVRGLHGARLAPDKARDPVADLA